MKTFADHMANQVNIVDERFYTNDHETYVPGVTTILTAFPKDSFYYNWLKEEGHNADVIRDAAADAGSKVHQAIDDFNNGMDVRWCTLDDQGNEVWHFSVLEWRMFGRYIEFYRTFKPNIISKEESFCDEELGYGGTIDLICELDNENVPEDMKGIWLIDHKTSNSMYASMELQLAAYAMMWNKKFPGYKVQHTGINWLKAKTKGPSRGGKAIQGEGWKLHTFDRPIEEAFKIFQHTHAIWKEANPNPKVMTYELPMSYHINEQ